MVDSARAQTMSLRGPSRALVQMGLARAFLDAELCLILCAFGRFPLLGGVVRELLEASR